MVDREKEMKRLKSELQALLCTEKEAITSRQLARQFSDQSAYNIPFIELGFRCLDDLLKSIPDVVYSYTNFRDGLLYVKAVPQEGSQHINELVAGQKKAKKRKPMLKSYNSSYANRFNKFRVSTSVAPNRNFNHYPSYNRMPERPQFPAVSNSRSHMVPQLMLPSQPTAAVQRAPTPPTPRAYSPPPRFRSTTSSSGNYWNNKNKIVSSNMSAAKVTPTASRVSEDRSNMKPQPMLPRNSAPTVSPPEYSSPPSPPDSIEDTIPTRPLFQWKQVEPARQSTEPSPIKHFVPPTESSLLASMANLNISTQSKPVELPPPLAMDPVVDLSIQVVVPQPVSHQLPEPSVLLPAARAPRVLLRNCQPVKRDPTPEPISLPSTPESISYQRYQNRNSSPPTTPNTPRIRRNLDRPPTVHRSVKRPTEAAICEFFGDVFSTRPSPSKPMDSKTGFLERLNRLVDTFNLGKVVLWKMKMTSGNFIASIKVGDKEFISYPREFADSTDAYECAAKEACAHFQQKPTWMKSL